MLSHRITKQSLFFIFISQISSGFSSIRLGETNESDDIQEFVFTQRVSQLEKMIKKIPRIT